MLAKLNQAKQWWKSKTFWIGTFQLIAALSLFGYEFLTEHKQIDNATVALLFINGAMMVVLRWLTSKPITSFHHRFDRLRGKD